jgi:CDP-diglyceride synthetase
MAAAGALATHLVPLAEALALITLANAGPVLAKKLLGARLARPLDGGAVWSDGRPLFGASKTLRGLAAALMLPAGAAPLLGLPAWLGPLTGCAAMAGDLASSFTKRRLGRPPSSQALGLDQVPESLLPLLALQPALGLSAGDILLGVATFFVGEVLLSRLLFRLHLRDRPY